ncbi:hypothetical protein LXL04_031883 [Taraxacum kok-saghyz]
MTVHVNVSMIGHMIEIMTWIVLNMNVKKHGKMIGTSIKIKILNYQVILIYSMIDIAESIHQGQVMETMATFQNNSMQSQVYRMEELVEERETRDALSSAKKLTSNRKKQLIKLN